MLFRVRGPERLIGAALRASWLWLFDNLELLEKARGADGIHAMVVDPWWCKAFVKAPEREALERSGWPLVAGVG